MAKVYVHYVGTLKGDTASPLKDKEQELDRWVPEKPDSGDVELIATDEYDGEIELFHKVYEIRVKVAGINVNVGLDVKFKGKIEYYKAKA